MPERIQRRRTKGWRMPPNTVSITRPGKWGNPFIVVGDMIYLNVKYRRPSLYPGRYLSPGDTSVAVKMFRHLLEGVHKDSSDTDLKYWHDHFANLNMNELKEKDLACFCPVDSPCHGSVLLELTNK